MSIQIMRKILRNAKKHAFLLRMKPSQAKLAQIKHDQITTFHTLRNNFPFYYNKLQKYNIAKFTTQTWEKYNTKLEKVFLPYPPFSFLRDPQIRGTMFVTAFFGKWLVEEVTFLEERIPRNKLIAFLQEDYVGDPILVNSQYLTSLNSIHHLYHIGKFLDSTRCNLDRIDTVVEWGGGYGNMAKILYRLKNIAPTYIIVDTPLFSCLQWLYLATILGEDNVNLLYNPNDAVHIGAINLVPLCLLDYHKFDVDLFISTWGLSESSLFSMDYVVFHGWFKAEHILLAYQGSNKSSPDADRLGRIAADTGAAIEEIKFLPGNYYAFK